MPHADLSLVPPEITSKAEFWIHVRDQLHHLLADQRNWVCRSLPVPCRRQHHFQVTNSANASSLIYHALLAFKPHFGNGDRAVNWCGEQRFPSGLVALLPSMIASRFHHTEPVFPSMHDIYKAA